MERYMAGGYVLACVYEMAAFFPLNKILYIPCVQSGESTTDRLKINYLIY